MPNSSLTPLAARTESSGSALELRHIAGAADGLPLLIATMHGKEQVLAQPLAELGFRVLLPIGYDTDALGTFSGDIKRRGSAFDTVLEKARRACELTGIARAIASEGTYRPSQTLFPGAVNAELLGFVDLAANRQWVEYLTDLPTRFVQGRVPPSADAPSTQALLEAIGWPQVRAIVVPHDPGLGTESSWVFKGVADHETLQQALSTCAAHSEDGWAHLETDLRAHMNPTRMASIAEVGRLLVDRLASEGYGSTAEGCESMALGS